MRKNMLKVDNSPLNYNLSNAKIYTTFLKRKRIEKKLTLENLAEGICTASYLSRIENNLVDVNDNYFIKLFKKLDIDYFSLRETKDKEIFKSLLKCYLKKDFNEGISLVNEAIKTSYYVSLEYELMILFDSIFKGLYEDARNCIESLNKVCEELLNEELIFYLYLTAMYAYLTNQGVFAYKQIIVLCEMDYLDNEVKWAVYDLALDVLFRVNQKELFFKYYYELMNESFTFLYPECAKKHKSRLNYYFVSLKLEQTTNRLFDTLVMIDEYYHNDIYELILKNYFRYNLFKEIDELSLTLKENGFNLAILSLMCLRQRDYERIKHLEESLKVYTFTRYERSFEIICKYTVTLLNTKIYDREHVQLLYNLLKEAITSFISIYGDPFFLDELVNELLRLTRQTNRVKDIVKIILEYNEYKNKLPFVL